ncbi:hypothetical protein [Halomonas binhaiensis]|uniref:Uncharacterized protein n=1 Tax=Halomonas binhaiensis TaxID=2562282 RepID=A0A5C1NCT6_9GAMM|nr:hypothetical protein [Halomonas binhaiensis]QEM80463.1 hypothetical protein E4T21_01995 [Halomonas binhaiensis]
MKIQMIPAVLAVSLLAAGSAYAGMDSAVLEEHMQAISKRADEASDQGRVAALEQQVKELEELLRKTMEESSEN